MENSTDLMHNCILQKCSHNDSSRFPGVRTNPFNVRSPHMSAQASPEAEFSYITHKIRAGYVCLFFAKRARPAVSA